MKWIPYIIACGVGFFLGDLLIRHLDKIVAWYVQSGWVRI